MEKESSRTNLFIMPSRGDADGQADTSSSNRSGAPLPVLSLQIRPNCVWLRQTLNTEIAGACAGVAYAPLLAARRDGPAEELLLHLQLK